MSLSLLVDLYELTMAAGYLREGMQDRIAVFDLYFRQHPFGGGYAVFAGLEPALEYLESLRFTSEDLGYLRSLGLFDEAFLSYLGGLRFRGEVTAAREGEVVFADEPLLTVRGALGEAQIVETALMNLINFQTLVATKAARLTHAAGEGRVIEFGARRAQGPDGALGATRAAYIGGARVTSHLRAGLRFGIPVAGTQAHSWVMAFPTELDAFRAYAAAFPDHCVLLVDTYDTLRRGIPNAIRVAEELRARGHSLRGVRLDSGDLVRLSQQARAMLDKAGFTDVAIVASNELDEEVIERLRANGARIDQYGVGTHLATAGGPGGGALGGVYKLVEIEGLARIKLSEGRDKATLPGFKKVWRASGAGGVMMDVIALADEMPRPGDPVFEAREPPGWPDEAVGSAAARGSGPAVGAAAGPASIPVPSRLEEIHEAVMNKGARAREARPLHAMADLARERLSKLPADCLRLREPGHHPVMVTRRLKELSDRMIAEFSYEDPR